MKPGRMERFNLSYDDVMDINPNIIYCSVSGFGSGSPYEGLPAWDIIVQAMGGVMSITGEEDGDPLWCGLPIGDLVASLFAVNSVLVSLYARERQELTSERVEVPMLDSLISLLTARAGHTFGTGEPFPRTGSRHPTSAPFGVYDTKDDRIVVAAGTKGLWPSFCRSIGKEELLEDSRFETQDDRLENREELMAILEARLRERTTKEWLEDMHAESVPAAPINDTKTVWEDEHVKKRELKRRMPREGQEDAFVIDHPIRYRNQDTQLSQSPPELGAHTEEVLREHGITGDELKRLYESGTVS
jgi:crotonobetainyl-CoA:carnitine CoA-transferase CaiB-like acyl-CoA transferase